MQSDIDLMTINDIKTQLESLGISINTAGKLSFTYKSNVLVYT